MMRNQAPAPKVAVPVIDERAIRAMLMGYHSWLWAASALPLMSIKSRLLSGLKL